MTMRMSAGGRAQLTSREGVRTKAYRDSVGVLTIGVGHTSNAGLPVVTADLVITRAQADEILSRDIFQYEAAVSNSVRVPLAQGQFDALVSFCFNIGAGGFRKSTVVKRLNAGDYKGAADAMLMWNKPAEIMGRRRSERTQFLAATGAPKPPPAIARPVAELPAEESISLDYLRAAGSRTIAGADAAKQGLTGSLASIGGATAALSQVQDVASQAQEAAIAVQSGVSALEMLRIYWPLIAIVALTGAAAFFAWRAWRGASLVTAARVDDAVSGLNVGR